MVSGNTINNRLNSLNINGAYSLPTSDGSLNFVMSTNGQGVASWQPTLQVIPSGSVIQTVSSTVNTVQTITATIPFNDTIPQISEGTQLTTVTLTPSNVSNILYVNWYVAGTANTGSNISIVIPFFQDSTENAIFSALLHSAQTSSNSSSGKFTILAGTTSPTTIKMKCGVSTGTFYVNGDNSGTRLFGGSLGLNLTVQEIKA